MKTCTNQNQNKQRKKTILILAVAVIALYTGLWFALSPQLERQWVENEQSRLLESISAGNGVLLLEPSIALAELNFYDGPEDEAETDIVAVASVQPEGMQNVSTKAQAEETADTNMVVGIGVLSIDKIGMQLPVVDGVSKKKLKVAVGRVYQTAEIGSIGNAVLAGHRSYEYGKYFNRLGELEVGDMITYQPKGEKVMSFEVYDIRTVRPDDQSAFHQPADRAEITLYTCTPVRVASHRLLIHAKLVTE